MKTNVGLWIDHKQAIVVTFRDSGEEIGTIASEVEKKLQRAGDSPLKGITNHKMYSLINVLTRQRTDEER